MTQSQMPSATYRQTLAGIMLAGAALAGCAGAVVRPSDSACDQDLARVKAATRSLQASVDQGSAPADRKPAIAELDAASDHARATCGPATAPFGLHLGSVLDGSSDKDSPGAQRARDPKNGGGY